MLWNLFVTFLKIGFISFGGGYAMIPVIQHEVTAHQWMDHEKFEQSVALAGMAPGPIATNSATLIGYQTAGFPGAVFSTLGMVLPSLLLMIVLSAFLYKVRHRDWVKATFYGLKPVVTGLVVYAAIHFGLSVGEQELLTWKTAGLLFIFLGSVLALIKYRMNPLAVIVLSGLLGIAFFN